MIERVGPIGDKARPEGGEGPPATERDLESPDDPSPVARLDTAGSDRVQLAEAPKELGEAIRSLGVTLELGRHLREAARDLELVDDRPVVEPGAADEKRHVAAGVDIRQHPARVALESCHRELLGRIDDVDEVPASRRLLGSGGLRRAEVEKR